MTDLELRARIVKFTRRIGSVATQAHLDRIIGSFPLEHQKSAINAAIGVISPKLELREVPLPIEIKPADSAAPTLTEDTAMRLNTQRDTIIELRAQIAEHEKTIKELNAQLAQQVDSARKELAEARNK